MNEQVLEVSGLGKSYRTSTGIVPVLVDVDFVVQRGESIAITGPSGSGKSTLLGLLSGLDLPSTGMVRVEGQNLAEMGESALAAFRGRRMGLVFQSYRLFPMLSAEENVRIPLELAGQRDAGATARLWLERVGLGARRTHRPGQLSGGEQQRVAVARALAPRPALLFADEPTGNLDSRTGHEIADLLFDLVNESGSTLLLVTHEAHLASRAGRAINLQDGRILNDQICP